MPTFKNRTQARVINLKPAYMSRVDAQNYVGMGRTSFTQASLKYRLKVYSYGTKKVWYKVDDLDKMMESFIILNNKTTA